MFKKEKYLLVITLLVTFLSIIIVNAQEVPIANSFRFPLEGDWSPLWQDFGKWNNQWNGYHLGEDVGREDADTKNYAVYPMADGIVKFADIVLGYTVIIEHKLPVSDPDGDYVCSVYYHMKRPGEGGIKLTLGEVASTDSPIGYVSGKRKDYKSLPHLHFGIRKGPYKSGKDPRTGFWYYPGYTTIKINNEVQKNPDDPTHEQILTDWFNPTADRPGFIESHIIQIEQSTIGASLYHIECSKPIAYGEKMAYLPVSVSGPADDLALMLTNPEGKMNIKFIPKTSLIDNFETRYLWMGEEPFSEGPYTLTVKTVTPEKVIYKREVWFTAPKNIQITGGEITLARKSNCYYVRDLVLKFKNDGDLPFFFERPQIVLPTPGHPLAEEQIFSLGRFIAVPSGEFKFDSRRILGDWFCYAGSSKILNATARLYKNGKIILTFPMKLTMIEE